MLTQTADFHTEGAYGLHLDVSTAHWFGVTLRRAAQPVGEVADRRTTCAPAPTGTSVALALQTGPAFTWCQSSFPFIGADTTTTVTVDLLTDFSCDPSVLADVRGLLIFLNPGSYEIDEVKAA